MKNLYVLWLFACLFPISKSGFSLTYTLNGGNWSVNSNWTGNLKPPNPLTTGNAIVITGNSQLNVNNIIIDPGATITITPNASLSFFNFANAFQFTNNGNFTNRDSSSLGN